MDNTKEYDKLSPVRKEVIDTIIKNIKEGGTIWKPGWVMKGSPCSGATGKRYKGVNSFLLTLVTMDRGYKSNKWITFNQHKKAGYTFKKDEEGNSLGTDQGVPIEFYCLMDRKTKKSFDPISIKELSNKDKEEYITKNVYSLRRQTIVFNEDLFDGPKEVKLSNLTLEPLKKNQKAEELIAYWNDNECPIFYGGDQSYYNPRIDDIHLPSIDSFYTMSEYYSTTLHEIAHSTGHSKRLNRNLSGQFGSNTYAIEELRAEIASVFMQQDLDITMTQQDLKNNSAYVASWKNQISDDPNVLFKAISDAEKITQFVIDKQKNIKSTKDSKSLIEVDENLEEKDIRSLVKEYKLEPYSIVKYQNGGIRIALIGEFGTTIFFNEGEAVYSDEDAKTLLRKMSEIDGNGGKTFIEVPFKDLSSYSIDRAKDVAIEDISDLNIKPSEYVKIARRGERVSMEGRGIESLKYMSDREVVSRAFNSQGGDKFKMLYEGEGLYASDDRNEYSLMYRIASFASQGVDQILRIFESSGQFREGKNSRYATLALEANEYAYKTREERDRTDAIRMGRTYKNKQATNQKVKG